ncbi:MULTISPECIES: nitrile hydratase subunit alpha [unclassified Pseudonocardia]|uniref:nitrile hydratase subunit alpha n=1 Tax=unclassified Pseudonocardia TaxID=2619320 RepID=UPI0001FFDC72|nr:MULTISPECIES: nitrile hydratase subunit alpha [unclassified Pseudonocardia]ALE73576.1 nitrile hydratase [Pseudonocardia sp. EC080625-04]ALL76891.1 nitrile hydratase [Pseudonocardia sp. EC080610-09]ALL83922.1 nitrile hydratase [Pseudonocardia sp. EC080619-01]OLM18643.1 Cobalt-containing nitrile hydratase subunit alpha [Pseudonocardia sp. Ae707_Ps1]
MSLHHDHSTITEDDRIAARVKAMEAILVEKGIIGSDAIDYMSSVYENEVGPQLGARIVARAWVDAEFRSRLLSDATEACKELGVSGMQGEEMVVLENTGTVHHLVVCTLCSCYPWPVLGLPPNWYKYPAYRARAVRDPRGVMAEFGLDLSESVEVQVWDSSAELRYWVLPRRPAGTDGWSEDRLAELVTRDSLIGVADVTGPAAA